MPNLDKPTAGQDVRTLHRNVEQLIDGINSFMNMVVLWESEMRGVGLLKVWPGGSQIYVKVADPGEFGGAPVPIASTCTVSCTPNPATVHQQVTVIATVPGSIDTSNGGGTIAFYLNGQGLGYFNITNQSAGFQTTNIPPGTNLIRAHFSGDAYLLPCDGSATEIVNNLGAPDMVLSSSSNPSNLNQAVDWGANLTGNPTPYPTGTVTFFIDGTNFETVTLVAGLAASDAVSDLTAGHHAIEADYNGDTNWGQTYRTLDQVVLAGALVELAIVPNPANFNQSVDIYIQVSGYAGTPTGQVQLLKDGSTWGGAVNLDSNGQAHLTLAGGTPIGDYSIVAAYSGDGNYSPAESAPVDFQIIQGVNSITLVWEVGVPLPGIITSMWAGGGGNNANQYQIQVPNNYTGVIHLGIVNNPWATVWNDLGQVIFNGPMNFGFADANNLPPGWPLLNGPECDVQITNGIGALWIEVYVGGLEVQGGVVGMTCVGHCWLQGDAGGTPFVINGASTYVLEFVPGP